jgi:hypothetical protein
VSWIWTEGPNPFFTDIYGDSILFFKDLSSFMWLMQHGESSYLTMFLQHSSLATAPSPIHDEAGRYECYVAASSQKDTELVTPGRRAIRSQPNRRTSCRHYEETLH